MDLKLNSFLGIEFGSSIIEATEKMLKRDNTVLDDKNSTQEILLFYGMKFAGRETLLTMLFFVNDKFCKGVVYIKPKLDANIISTYNTIQNELNSKYFNATNYEIYEDPYEKNDGYTETGISLGKVTFNSFWIFKNNIGLEENSISLIITNELEITIAYEHGELTKELIEKINRKNFEDY
jgi:hypothetical protein